MDRSLGGERVPVASREVKRVGLERPIAARLRRQGAYAVLVIVLDRLTPRVERLVRAAVAQDQVVLTEMVEQRRKPLLEQREPMLHPGHAAAVGQRLVERIAGCGCAELFTIGRAE